MTSSRQTKRGRRRRRAKLSSRRSVDQLNKALGEFLTEMGRVEFTMLLYVDLINEAPIEHLFDEYSQKTFGPKVDWFKTWVEFGGVPLDKRVIVDRVYDNLKALRSNGLNVVAMHHHMTSGQPAIFFLHYWGTGSTEKLANGFKAALNELGRPTPHH